MKLTIQPVPVADQIGPQYTVECDGEPVMTFGSYDAAVYNVDRYQRIVLHGDVRDGFPDNEFVAAMSERNLQRAKSVPPALEEQALARVRALLAALPPL
jgi:hypothetical protein